MILLSILIVSAIAAVLAGILVIAQRFIANYGECKIKINNDEPLVVEGGNTLLESLTQNKIFIPSACGGRGTCGYCKLKVLEGGGPVAPTEESFLTATEKEEGVRLSCQVKVRNDISVEIPKELASIREYKCRCTRITNLTHDMKEFHIELEDPKEIDYVPGQYIQLFCPSYNKNEEVYRAYSIASDPSDKTLVDLVIRLVPGGICTTWCFDYLKEGDDILLNGPYGEFHLTDTDAPMLFVAGGSGMAPIKCMLHYMVNTNNMRKATYYFGASMVKELCYEDLMKKFEDSLTNYKFVPVVSRPGEDEDWDGETGLVTEAIERNEGDLSGHEAYLCGSPGMIDATVKLLAGKGMPEEKIFYDKFA